MPAPSDPAEIVDMLETQAGKTLDILMQEHGTTRGTYEAALAEFQGLEILKDSADAFRIRVTPHHADHHRRPVCPRRGEGGLIPAAHGGPGMSK
jgi:hypothetical protein